MWCCVGAVSGRQSGSHTADAKKQTALPAKGWHSDYAYSWEDRSIETLPQETLNQGFKPWYLIARINNRGAYQDIRVVQQRRFAKVKDKSQLVVLDRFEDFNSAAAAEERLTMVYGDPKPFARGGALAVAKPG